MYYNSKGREGKLYVYFDLHKILCVNEIYFNFLPKEKRETFQGVSNKNEKQIIY